MPNNENRSAYSSKGNNGSGNPQPSIKGGYGAL